MASNYLTPYRSGQSVQNRDPFHEMHRQMDRLFDDMLSGSGDNGSSGSKSPSMDVHQTDKGLEVTAEMPGIAPEDMDLKIDGDMLTISGEKQKKHQDKQAHLMECSYGSFRRSVQLPFSPDPDKVQANCDNGVLTIDIPRPQDQDKSRKIEVGSGSSSQSGKQQGSNKQPAIGSSWKGDDQSSGSGSSNQPKDQDKSQSKDQQKQTSSSS